MKRINPDHPLTQAERNKRFYEKHKSAELERNKEYIKNNREKVNRTRRNYRHGITQEWFDAKLAEQNNCCALCGELFVETPRIDHKHSCCPPLKSCDKCRRDLVCNSCNVLIGMCRESEEILLKGIQYLRRHADGR